MYEELIGTVFDGRFNIEKILGTGGMGAVFLVEHEVLQRRFALKMIHQRLLKDESLQQLFRREARAASRVQHPNVTFVFDYAESDTGVPYIVMEYVDGITLSHELRESRRGGQAFPTERALHILAQVCDALSAAHACGVVHRDLKPANVALTTRRGRKDFVKVLDFGLAKLTLGSTTYNSADARAIFGTPEYMAPEQCLEGQEAVDHRADIYGVGIMAYEIFAEVTPFVGDPLAIIFAHQENEPTHLREKAKGKIPERLAELVMSCLQKQPEKRPQSALELAAEFRALQDESGVDDTGIQRPRVSATMIASFYDETRVGPVGAAGIGLGGHAGPVGLNAQRLGWTELPAPVDRQGQDLEDLVQTLRENKLGSENTVHLLSRMLEMDEAVLETEAEVDLMQGEVLHIDMRYREREAKLREALVQLEHEAQRQRTRMKKAPGEASTQLTRLEVRTADLAERIRALREERETRLEALELKIETTQEKTTTRRDDATNLRGILQRQLEKIQHETRDEGMLALFLSSSR
ncbi:MAG: protein kinase [Deltaproteobacteria bacterium]|nr:protein kinase [Deltaproteobacteria bacterium]